MYQIRDLARMSRDISAIIEDELSRVGIFFRIFGRVKSHYSVKNKIKVKGENYYDGKSKLLRDIIGIRVVLYFSDDIQLIYSNLKKIFELVEETIDPTGETNFEPTRINLVFRLPEKYISEFKDVTKDPIIDTTFELQLRTILSEGWHEVDHDLRYKCLDNWKDQSDLARSFNGILATLETSEYAILRIFDQLAFRHLKNNEFEALMRSKLRIRLENFELSDSLKTVLSPSLIKEFYKIDRNHIISYLFESGFIIPLTLENLVYLINHQFVNDIEIIKLTPLELFQKEPLT